jgi:hypothetical protein
VIPSRDLGAANDHITHNTFDLVVDVHVYPA